MKCTYDKLPEFIQHFLVQCSTELAKERGLESVAEIWPDMFDKDNTTPQEWEIEVKVNGVELPVLPFFERMEECFDENVEEKAEQILNQQFGEVWDVIADIESSVRESFERRFTEYKRDEDGSYILKEDK
jgi:hypothetical protein